MKTKKLLHIMAMFMVVVLSVGMVSCGSDDDEEEEYGGGGTTSTLQEKLQGTWEFQSGTETISGITIRMDRSSLSEMKKSMEQVAGARIEIWDETLTFRGSKVNGVNYTLKGNELILDGVDAMDGISISVKSVTSSTLVLHETISVEDIELTADIEYSKK